MRRDAGCLCGRLRARVEGDEARDLALRHLRRGDVHAGDAGRHHHLGLAERGAADAERAGLHLAPGDGNGFVRLRVRTERDAGGARMRRHRRDVPFERVEIDQQRRRVERMTAAGLADKGGIGAEASHCPTSSRANAGLSTSRR